MSASFVVIIHQKSSLTTAFHDCCKEWAKKYPRARHALKIMHPVIATLKESDEKAMVGKTEQQLHKSVSNVIMKYVGIRFPKVPKNNKPLGAPTAASSQEWKTHGYRQVVCKSKSRACCR